MNLTWEQGFCFMAMHRVSFRGIRKFDSKLPAVSSCAHLFCLILNFLNPVGFLEFLYEFYVNKSMNINFSYGLKVINNKNCMLCACTILKRELN
jgi:hypothetical protein